MKRIALMVMGLGLATAAAGAEDAPVLKTDKDKISYTVGLQTGRNLRRDEIDVDAEMMARGLKDGMAGEKALLPEKELRAVMNAFQAQVRTKIAANRLAAATENRRKETAFLAENAKKEGVVVLPSGVQYKVVRAGEGLKPKLTDSVRVNYRGTRLDGYEFDASPEGKPANLQVGKLIAGWKDALQQMPVNSKWQIVVPAAQAYGERGAGADIGPNQTLVFDVELVGID